MTETMNKSMKKLVLIIFALTLPLVLHAQKEVGTTTIYPRLGLNWSKFTHDGVIGSQEGEYYDSKYRMGFTGGAEVQHQFSNIIAGSIGALYSHQGTDYEDMPYTKLSMKTDNILVPVLIVATTRVGLNFKLGVQPEFIMHSNADYVLNKVNLSIPVGLAYEWNHIALDVRYNIGDKDGNSYGKASHGGAFLVTLGYGFDF